MHAYLFSAVVTRSQRRGVPGHPGSDKAWQTWDSATSIIVLGNTPEEAQSRFESWLSLVPEGEDPVQVNIRKIAAAQFVDPLLAESGNPPADWPEIPKRAEALIQSTPVDDFEQGYWVDVDQVVRPEKLSFSLGTLPSDLPEDLRTGLNWSADKKFLFVLSVLAPLPSLAELAVEPDPDAFDSEDSLDAGADLPEPIGIAQLYATYPQALDKAAAALIEARNSVVAAWLWRRFAAGTPLAASQIRIDPWCGVLA